MTPSNPTNSRPALAVMYHYVRPDHSPIPAGIRPMLVSEFERQLDWLEQHYTIASPDDFARWLGSPDLGGRGNGTPLPVSSSRENHGQTSLPMPPQVHDKPPCLLTFDDGTADHAEVVTAILARRNLPGLFFVLSGPAEQSLMPLTHALHWLLGQPDDQIWRLFEQYAHDTLHDPAALGDPAEARRIYHYEPELRARIKYAANMAMPAEATNAILRRSAHAAGQTLEDLAKSWFVSPDQIVHMHKQGMTIASHGHSHSSLQTLGPAGIRQEIAHASAYLTHLTGQRPTWWACPFGGSGAPPETLAAMRDAMRSAGLTHAVTTIKSPVTNATDPQAIPRYDCIDLPPRKPTAPPELNLA